VHSRRSEDEQLWCSRRSCTPSQRGLATQPTSSRLVRFHRVEPPGPNEDAVVSSSIVAGDLARAGAATGLPIGSVRVSGPVYYKGMHHSERQAVLGDWGAMPTTEHTIHDAIRSASEDPPCLAGNLALSVQRVRVCRKAQAKAQTCSY